MSYLPQALFRTLDRTADWAGIGPGHLDADEMMDTALRRAGRYRFTDTSFVGPLKRLLWAYEQEADLCLFGRFAARFDILRSLANLLRFDAVEDDDPGIVQRCIERPIFITGLPRSGTTFLHTLLALDPANAVPRSWQLVYPYPDREHAVPDRRRARVDRQLWLFRHLTPELEGMHPIAADAPQECTDITAQVFQSLRFDTTHRIPSYLRWIDSYGHLDAFRFHRRFLQHLDAQAPGKRWILKCPDHIFTLDAIRTIYPDACIVLLHRDPLSVLASVTKLTELLRRPFSRHVDRHEIGRQVSERWGEGADRMVQMREQSYAHPILHMQYSDVVSAPLRAVEILYDHAGRGLSNDARERMQTYVKRMPRGGYRQHHYDLAEFGLDAAQLRKRFSAYLDAYGIAPGSALRSMTAGHQSAA